MATQSKTLLIRISDELRASLDRTAEAQATTVSDWVRDAIEEKLQRSPGDTADNYEAFANIAGKLVPIGEVLSDVVIRRREVPAKKKK